MIFCLNPKSLALNSSQESQTLPVSPEFGSIVSVSDGSVGDLEQLNVIGIGGAAVLGVVTGVAAGTVTHYLFDPDNEGCLENTSCDDNNDCLGNTDCDDNNGCLPPTNTDCNENNDCTDNTGCDSGWVGQNDSCHGNTTCSDNSICIDNTNCDDLDACTNNNEGC